MEKNELVEKVEERTPSDVNAEPVIDTVLAAYAEVRLPELEEELGKFEGKRFTTLGRIEEVEELKDL